MISWNQKFGVSGPSATEPNKHQSFEWKQPLQHWHHFALSQDGKQSFWRDKQFSINPLKHEKIAVYFWMSHPPNFRNLTPSWPFPGPAWNLLIPSKTWCGLLVLRHPLEFWDIPWITHVFSESVWFKDDIPTRKRQCWKYGCLKAYNSHRKPGIHRAVFVKLSLNVS